MKDERLARVAGTQFNRVSRAQLAAIGMSDDAIAHRVSRGRLTPVEEGVYALAPVLTHDSWGRWMGATLTAPKTYLCRESAACARGALTFERHDVVTVVRRGTEGPVDTGAFSFTAAGPSRTRSTSTAGFRLPPRHGLCSISHAPSAMQAWRKLYASSFALITRRSTS
jgi:hypothetical protein